MWDNTCESNLEYLRTLYAKEKYERALREKVRTTFGVSCFIYITKAIRIQKQAAHGYVKLSWSTAIY